MKLKIIFIELSSDTNIITDDYDKVIFIKDPYHINIIDGSRNIVGADSKTISYEKYCFVMHEIILNTINDHMSDQKNEINAITVESCKEPPNFKVLMKALSITRMSFSSKCNITIKNCSFTGSLYINSIIRFIKAAREYDRNMFFNIMIDEKSHKVRPSKHDQAKLAAINNVTFFPNANSAGAIRVITDDQHIGLTNNKLQEISNPTYFFRSNKPHRQHSPRAILVEFFSQVHQQQSDYTCGPAALKMVADYYASLSNITFCGAKIDANWNKFNVSSELRIANHVNTTEVEGSEIADMREGLMKVFGFSVLDDADGLSEDEHQEIILKTHKEKLWGKFINIFNLGVPIIINLRDRDEIGHYEVAIGIDDSNQIIMAEPGSALNGHVEFELIPKEKFIDRWKNMSGKLHGRFLITPPNEITAHKIGSILHDVDHYFNGEKKEATHKDSSRLSFN